MSDTEPKTQQVPPSPDALGDLLRAATTFTVVIKATTADVEARHEALALVRQATSRVARAVVDSSVV